MGKFLDNCRISQKLLIGFGSLLACMFVVMLAGINGLRRVNDSVGVLATRSTPGLVALNKFAFLSGQSRINTYRAAGLSGEKRQAALKDVETFAHGAEDALADYKKTLGDPEQEKRFGELTSGWSEYRSAWSAALDKLQTGDGDTSFQAVEKGTSAVFRGRVKAGLISLMEWNDKNAQSVNVLADHTVASTNSTIWIVGFLALAAGAALGTVISRRISAPLKIVGARLEKLRSCCVKSMVEAMQAVERGDLTIAVVPQTTPVEVDSKDEAGQMARTFNEMLGMMQSMIVSYESARVSLGALVRDISRTADDVQAASQSLAATAEQSGTAANEIAGGSEKLAQSATTAAGVMDELAAQVNAVNLSSATQQGQVEKAGKALAEAEAGIESVAKAAETMAAAANEGNDAVERTVASMSKVQDRVTYSAERIQELDERGKQIGHIVQSIESIAGQTNLLALNAAIEAARAGEHGRGFAVVADEVRKLAEQAANATQEIASLIDGVTATVGQTVKAIEETKLEVENGSHMSAQAGGLLVQILSASAQVAAQSQEVSATTQAASATMRQVATSARENQANAKEMAVGTERVTGAITGVAAVSEETAAGAEELTASVEEVACSATSLSNMSNELKSLVAQFKVEDQPQDAKLRLAA
jgi:methyl-accepting chemotaxis protein